MIIKIKHGAEDWNKVFDFIYFFSFLSFPSQFMYQFKSSLFFFPHLISFLIPFYYILCSFDLFSPIISSSLLFSPLPFFSLLFSSLLFLSFLSSFLFPHTLVFSSLLSSFFLFHHHFFFLISFLLSPFLSNSSVSSPVHDSHRMAVRQSL